jgi:hypothetical protein
VKQVHGDDRLTTIVVGQGEHHIDGHYVDIASAMRIVGDPGVPKEKIVVVGGREWPSATPDTASSEEEWRVWVLFLFYDGRCPCGTVW